MIFGKKKSALKISLLNKERMNSEIEFRDQIYKVSRKEKKREGFWYNPNLKQNVFILNFKGDISASQVESLKKEVNAIISVAHKDDLVLFFINSGGGTVTGYGLVADQIQKLKNANLKVHSMIEQVAASGGYMAACVADKIFTNERAFIGSIGVIASIPNVTNLLSKIGIEMNDYTAGKYKRGVVPYKTPSDEQVEDLNKDLGTIHQLFKDHVSKNRKSVNIEEVSTGKVWTAKEALDLNLIDGIIICDEVINDYITKGYLVYDVSYDEKRTKGALSNILSEVSDNFIEKIAFKLTEMISSKNSF